MAVVNRNVLSSMALLAAALLLLVAPAAVNSAHLLFERQASMTLYVTQVPEGGSAPPNQAVVVTPSDPSGFGTVVVTDWPVADGPGTNATIVGRAHGMHYLTSKTDGNKWVNTLTIAFQDTSRFSGSTLQVMGFIPQDGEWSIIGGTGRLTMARGIIRMTVIQEGGGTRIYKLDVTVFYTPLM